MQNVFCLFGVHRLIEISKEYTPPYEHPITDQYTLVYSDAYHSGNPKDVKYFLYGFTVYTSKCSNCGRIMFTKTTGKG